MSEEPEIEIDWQKRFPKMTPVGSVPSLSTINGCGLSLYGGRDHDPITGTYIKTHVFVLVFIPILALKAFRVADAETGGWYFIGREPLSGFARGWNKLLFMLLFAVIGSGVWNGYMNSPEKVAERTLAEARSVQAAGDIMAAATAYRGLLGGPQNAAAKAALNEILETELASQSPANQARLLDFFVRLERNARQRLGHDHYPAGLKYAQAARESDLTATYKILQTISPLADKLEDPSEYHETYEAVLVARIAESPDDLDLLGEYAAVLEQRDGEGDHEKLIALLEPRREALGSTEGARILGEHEANQGNLDAALKLLRPYTEARLEAYHKAETSFEKASERSWQSNMKALENGKAGSSWYKKYEAANDDQQGAMVQGWIGKKMENDSGLAGHRQRFIDAASVVPHAMDLGILLLQHAQGLEDADVRRAELESSEAIFMSVQGAAGDNPQYQLFLGQVKYWLGKSAEGEALFTQFLSSGDPDEPPFSAMLAVASTYREVGETAKARALYEDVYNRADDEEIKDSAANMRAITATDTDDSLHWLKLCKAQSPSLRANLAANLGLKAAADGDVDEAVHKFNEAIKIYDKMPESSVTLNNSALVFGHIFDATGDIEQHSPGVARLRKAHSLSPDDSITMGNFARHLNTSAALAVTRDAIDYPVLREHASSSLFSSIATDRDSRLALEKRMLENAEFREAANYLSKARVLSPKSLHLYSNLVRVYSLQGDVDGLKKLYNDLVAAELDLTQMNAEFLDIYAGNQDETRLADAQYEFADFQARAKADVGASPPTVALLHIYVADAVENLWNLNRSVDPDLAIQAAEAAVAIHSSQNARRTLASSYILRSAASTLPENAVFAKFAAMNSIVSTVAVALNGKDEAVRNAILGNADFKKGFALYKEEALADDDVQSPWLWAIARHADAKFANTVAAKVKSDELSHVSRQIIAAMTPLSGGSIYGLAWAAELGGDTAAAEAILAQARAAGVPLP